MRVLVTGATGYIGGRLVPALLEAGHDVRCLTRDPKKLDQDPWRDQVEVVPGDVLDAATLAPALNGCEAAYYLVHSMDGGTESFQDRDRKAAINFRDAAAEAGLGRDWDGVTTSHGTWPAGRRLGRSWPKGRRR